MDARVNPSRVRELFQAACDLPQGERGEYLESACAGDPILRAEVESLLHYDASTDDLLDESRLGTLLDAPHEPPARVGNYRIIRRLGAGGMGEVFEAEQESPLRRVALKVMHTGGSREVARRMRREGTIQARLAHPGIAAVYETGIHFEGSRAVPYFAMELVNGRQLMEYCTLHKLDARERLTILLKVCDAVVAAHQQGVIHRDLKPANILVVEEATGERSAAGEGEEPEGGARPKVLDFGVAKLTGHDVLTTMGTEAGRIIGTLSYMSPEQIQGEQNVDVRTDIYALGLIMYELLADQPARRTGMMTLAAAARQVAELEIPRLGTAAPAYRGDLETIVAKATAREKERRYPSVSEFAADIRRYLRSEPITARPATAVYQLRMFARRNRGLVVAGAVAILALLGGVVGTALQARAAIAARDEAARKATEAEQESKIADAVAGSLRSVFQQATPESAQGKDPTLREAIDRLATGIEKEYDGPPEAEAIVRNIIGIVERTSGEYDKALGQFQRALDIRRRVLPHESNEIAEVLHNIALVKSMKGDAEGALPMLAEALEIQKKVLGEDDPVVARSMYNLARATWRANKFDDALRITRESLALHQKMPNVNGEVIAMHYSQIATIEQSMGRTPDAERDSERSLEQMRKSVSATHPSLAVCLCELAKVKLAAGKLAEADAASAEAVKVGQAAFAQTPEHPSLRVIQNVRAKVVEAMGQAGAAPPAG